MTTIAEIQAEVCRRWNASSTVMSAPAKHGRLVGRHSDALLRQIAMYAAREVTGRSYALIGRYLGGRDRTTVCHAHQRVPMLAAADPDLGERVQALLEHFRGR